MDPTPCLPDPVPPDWNRYYQILALVTICWLLALWEPYGLRLRHTVMVTYHPDRARERAMWLYNRIISNRISFVKTSRRKLRKKYTNFSTKDTFRCRLLGLCTPKCLLCDMASDSNTSFKCTMPNCPGIYCASCFSILKFCNICRDPAEYGDTSDISEEKDSSEEEVQTQDKRERPCTSRTTNEILGKKKSVKEQKYLSKEISPLITSSSSGDRAHIYETIKPRLNSGSVLLKKESYSWEKTNSFEGASSSKRNSVPLSRTLDERGKKTLGSSRETKSKDGRPGQKPSCRWSGNDMKPDFKFRKRDNVSFESVSYSKAKDTAHISELRLTPSSDAGVLVAAQRKKDYPKDLDSLSTWDCPSLPLDPHPEIKARISETRSQERSEDRLPFIDPVNVHEFLPEPDSAEREKDESSERKEKDERGKIFVYKKDSSVLDEKPRERDSVKIFFREESEMALTDVDGQFYSESYRSRHSVTRKSKASRKRSLDNKADLCSIETDSSFENYLSVKVTSKRKEREKRRSRTRTPSLTRKNNSEMSTQERDRKPNAGHSSRDDTDAGRLALARDPGRSHSSHTCTGATYSEEELNILVLGTMESRSDCN